MAGLHVGPVDLGLGLGLGLDREHEPFHDALRSIVAAGHTAGIPVTMHAVRPAEAERWLETLQEQPGDPMRREIASELGERGRRSGQTW